MLELVDIISFLLGIGLLHYGSDLLVDNGSLLAKKYNISKLIIGMSLVAFGTSLPELIVSMIAVFKGKLDLVTGNVVGSNIANIGLVLGVSGLAYNILSDFKKIKIDIVFLIISTISFLLILFLNEFSALSGFVLISILVMYIYMIVWSDKIKDFSYEESYIDESFNKLFFFLLLGVLALSIGSYSLIEGAISIARYFNISELVIGATAIALGTSLPELVTCLRAARKNEFELVLGNIFGSNIINIVLVFSLSLLVNSNVPGSKDFSIDIIVLSCLTILLILTLSIGRIFRFISLLFLSIYIYYIYTIL